MKIKKLIKYTFASIGIFLFIIILSISFLYFSADMKQPNIPEEYLAQKELVFTDSVRLYDNNYLHLSPDGLWELKLKGNSFERGVAFGTLAQDLLKYQETVFVDQIRTFIPSDSYLKFLRFMLILFNRNLGTYVPQEYREEIYGISLYCTDEYNAIGTPYERQLNYHAAHDIGHAMQDYMLVGCTSFGVWGEESQDSTLLISRNFDFYVGEEFARHKLVSFYEPDEGYRFASVGWAGMIGVLSGMNEAGLSITINAAKSTVPTSAATPISILAREILQYASTIEEAYQIAQSRKTFVSESLLIGSAKDKRAAIIEKSPDKTSLFESGTHQILCTNHYQSEEFKNDKRNIENIATSDSRYRMKRLEELISKETPLNPEKAAGILRNRKGVGEKEIGLSNEKAINQFIAHHAVIFQPEKGLMWVSTDPWQCGKFVGYDLNKTWEKGELFTSPIHKPDTLVIPADPFLQSQDYKNLVNYRTGVKKIREHIQTQNPLSELEIESFLTTNPEMYYSWELIGDYFSSCGEKEKAKEYWTKALEKEIPTQQEQKSIQKKLNQ